MGEVSKSAREVLLKCYWGILSTHSQDMLGFPFGSLVPYCLDKDGRPFILISTIAQHTKNVIADPKVSLTVTLADKINVQSSARLTYLAEVQECLEESVEVARYYSFYPDAQQYHGTHKFKFFRLNLVRARYIGGFGDIHWVEADQLCKKNPFGVNDEKSILDHMNQDHQDSIRHYCFLAGWDVPDGVNPKMVGIDGEGFDISIGGELRRFTFAEEVRDMEGARKVLIDLARYKV